MSKPDSKWPTRAVRAADLTAALRLVRRTYGVDAPIVETRRRGDGVEILVAAASALSGRPRANLAPEPIVWEFRTPRETAWTGLDGEHWFVGLAGVGKTTLVQGVLARLRECGKEALVVTLPPGHRGPHPPAHWERALSMARGRCAKGGVLLVDTPCAASYRLPEAPANAFVHWVAPLGGDPASTRSALGPRSADFLALTQIDLSPWPGRLMDWRDRLGCPVSLVQGRTTHGIHVQLAAAVGAASRPAGLTPGVRARAAKA